MHSLETLAREWLGREGAAASWIHYHLPSLVDLLHKVQDQTESRAIAIPRREIEKERDERALRIVGEEIEAEVKNPTQPESDHRLTCVDHCECYGWKTLDELRDEIKRRIEADDE